VHLRALALGADLVMHSATKYLNGHSDALAGALVTAACDEPWQRLRAQRHDGGAVLGPFEAWLVHCGCARWRCGCVRQSASALAIAAALEATPARGGVLPGCLGTRSTPWRPASHRRLSAACCRCGSAAAEAALAVAGRLRCFARATSLGGVESLVEHRATVERLPVLRDLLRLSIAWKIPTIDRRSARGADCGGAADDRDRRGAPSTCATPAIRRGRRW
jgi:cystathionine gamma-synthase